jgi:hypothetical protein
MHDHHFFQSVAIRPWQWQWPTLMLSPTSYTVVKAIELELHEENAKLKSLHEDKG